MSAAQADDVNTAPVRSTDGDPAFDTGAIPFSLAVLPDGSKILVGSVPDVGRKIASFRPDPGVPGNFQLNGSILGTDHNFGSAVGLSFDSSKRVWMTDVMGPAGPTVNSYAASFAPGLPELAPRLSISGNYTGLHNPADVLLTKSGEIVVPDLSEDKVVIFPAGTGGNIKPARTIEVGISSPFGAALDSAGRIYVANSANDSITVYPANATSATTPSQVIMGPDTKLSGPRKIAVDTSNNIYVTNFDASSVTVFAAGATGNVAPVKRLVGANTLLDQPVGIALDAERRVYVVNGINSGVGKILVQFPTLRPFLKPSSVRSIKVSGSSKSKTRTLSWSVPANDGGTPITKYRVLVKKGSSVLYNKYVTSRSYKVSRSKLKSGLNRVYVYAYNKVGVAPYATKTFTVKK